MKRFDAKSRGGNKRKFNRKFEHKNKRPYRGPWWMQDDIQKDPAKVDERRLLASFDHRMVRVREGEDYDRAIKRFNKMIEMAGVLSELKKREFYRSPSETVRDKKLKAQKRLRKNKQKTYRRPART